MIANETQRLLNEANRQARVTGSSAAAASGPQASGGLNTGLIDPVTGEWAPYGRVGITARESFRVRGTALYGRVGIDPRQGFRVKGT